MTQRAMRRAASLHSDLVRYEKKKGVSSDIASLRFFLGGGAFGGKMGGVSLLVRYNILLPKLSFEKNFENI